MKASELITSLQSFIAEFGDLPVMAEIMIKQDYAHCTSAIDCVDIVEFEKPEWFELCIGKPIIWSGMETIHPGTES